MRRELTASLVVAAVLLAANAGADVITTIAGGQGSGRWAGREISDATALGRKVYTADGLAIRAYDPLTESEAIVLCNGTFGRGCDRSPADSDAPFNPSFVAGAPDGTLIVVQQPRLWRLDPAARTLTHIAGTNGPGCTTDDTPGLEASFGFPWEVTVDPAGNIFFADLQCGVIRRIDVRTGRVIVVRPGFYWSLAAVGTNELVAITAAQTLVRIRVGDAATAATETPFGNVTADDLSDVAFDASARTVLLSRPSSGRVLALGLDDEARRADVAVFPSRTPPLRLVVLPDTLYVASLPCTGELRFGPLCNRVFEVRETIPVPVVGDATPLDDTGRATDAQLRAPFDVAVSAGGTIVFAELANKIVRTIENGEIATILGTGAGHLVLPPLRSRATETEIYNPSRVAVDGNGLAYVTLGDGFALLRVSPRVDRSRRIYPNGVEPSLVHPVGIAATEHGVIYVADEALHCVARLVPSDAGYRVEIVAGRPTISGYDGEGGPATAATLNRPRDVAVAPDGTLYIADSGNDAIRRVRVDRVIETVVSPGHGHLNGRDIAAGNFQVDSVAADAYGAVFFTIAGGRSVFRAYAGEATTIAGTGALGFAGDGGPPLNALFDEPRGLAVDTDGAILVADSMNHRIRRIELSRDCGNGRLDEGEQCDPTVVNVVAAELDCCRQDCQFQPAGTRCGRESWLCSSIARCNGRSGRCPLSVPSCVTRLGNPSLRETDLGSSHTVPFH